MTIRRLLFITTFAVRFLAGQNQLATDQAFAAYDRSVSDQLSAMLQDEQTQRVAVPEIKLVKQNQPPDERNEVTIKTFARRFWAGRDAEVAAALVRLHQLRPRLESILDTEGLPRQLVAVVLVESGAEPLAASPRQARGLWQLIPATARRYGLTVSSEKDERVDLEAATRAATHYLRDLYIHFGDWPLALAAYNAGQNAVDGALERSGSQSFWQLSSAGILPPETRSYVPAVLAAMSLLSPAQPVSPTVGKAQKDDRVYASVGIAN